MIKIRRIQTASSALPAAAPKKSAPSEKPELVDIEIDAIYEENIGITCSFCNRQPMEKEEMVILKECGHPLCATCFERLQKFRGRSPICPLCLRESSTLKQK